MPAPNERDRDVERKREKRSEAARITIPEVVDPKRRISCLDDPEKFLKTYFPQRYTIPFGSHHYAMIDSLISRAKYGGRQAVAAPRGCGKTECFKGMTAYLILAMLVRFPLLGGATTTNGKRLYQDFRTKIATNDLLYEDFPEVCHPVRALEGAPQRASKQHVDGRLTKVVWTATDYLRLPDVPGTANRFMQDQGWDASPYGGVKMAYFGLDSAFRGFNIDGDRPDFVGIDDPETRESAKSYDQGVDREEIIDKDIAGLVSQEGNISIAVLTTAQNCYCLSYRITDPKIKPAFNGLRYGMIKSWPKNLPMWDDYIAMRHADQVRGDEHGMGAVAFYLENREAMDEGVEMLSEHFVPIELEDSRQAVHSAIQQAFNKIADTSLEAYKTEYQNNPTPDEEETKLDLTPAIVASRISGLPQNVLPEADDIVITVGLDIGDYWGDWVKIAWFGNATGVVIDYGVMEVPTMQKGLSREAKEIAIHRAIMTFAPQLLAEHPPDLCMIDSGDGDHKDAVYHAVKDLGGLPFVASKGWDAKRFRMPVITDANKGTKRAFKDCHAAYQPGDDIWLYNVNTEEWKHWLQKRFVTPTFDEIELAKGNRVFNAGSLSLYASDDRKRHMSISHHFCSERREKRFEEGKGWVVRQNVLNKNNHKLDAGALACCSAGCLGVELIESRAAITEIAVAHRQPKQASNRFTNPHGRPFVARR